MAIAEYIHQVLRGEYPEGEAEYPHLLLVSIYRNLAVRDREDFHDALILLLRDLAQGADHLWNDVGDELLLLVEDVIQESSRREEAIDLLLAIQSQVRVYAGQPDLHLRALGTLLGLRYRGTPDFWEQVYSSHDCRYAFASFEGLASIDLHRAFQWLVSIEGSVAAEVLRECLPNLIKEFGAEPILRSLRPIFGFLIPEARESVHYALSYEGLSISVVAMDADFLTLRMVDFLRGEIEEEELASSVDNQHVDLVYEALETLLGRWKVSTYRDTAYSARFCRLLKRFPSPKAFAAIVTFVEIATEIHPPPTGEGLWRAVMDAFHEMRSIARQFLAEELGALQPVVRSYFKCLQRLMDFEQIAPEAYEELVAVGGAREILVRATRKAFLYTRIAPKDCLDILRNYLGKDDAELLLGALLKDEADSGRDFTDLARILYRLSPSLIEESSLEVEAIYDVEERIVPGTLRDGLSSLAELLNAQSGGPNG